jgi:hypothetical protein
MEVLATDPGANPPTRAGVEAGVVAGGGAVVAAVGAAVPGTSFTDIVERVNYLKLKQLHEH